MENAPANRGNPPRRPSPLTSPPQPSAQRELLRLLRGAEAAWKQQDYQKSIDLIEQASRADPSNPSILLNLARAYGLRYNYAAAERSIERAVQVSSRRTETLAEAGLNCLEFQHLDMAIRYLGRASRAKDVSVGTLITLADIYVREARFDDAADLVAHARQLDRHDPRVRLREATLRRHAGKSEEAESILRALRANPGAAGPAGEAIRLRALFELGALLDRAGRYDEAMAALFEAKAIQRTRPAHRAAILRLMRDRAIEMERTITADVLDRWRAGAAQLRPPRRIALLCGHPRSGTTLLEQVLDAHTDIVSAEETRMMHDEAYLPIMRDVPEDAGIRESLDAASPDLLCHARENYFGCTERYIQKPIGGRLLIDKNPGLNGMIPIFVRVFPEAKFLVPLRDPRDVVVSCFMLPDLQLAPTTSAYLSIEGTVQDYAAEMGFWLAMQPRLDAGQWMQVRYEDLVDDLPGTARATLSFLGVAYEDSVLKFHEHARTKRVKSPTRADVVKPLYRTAMGRWRNYQKYLDPYMKDLERFLKAFGYE
jgi:tetratricopeptide (TPR) repeat protein